MKPVAVITDDKELTRLLTHLGMEADFPKTAPSRSPPWQRGDEDAQWDPAADKWDGVDEGMPEA